MTLKNQDITLLNAWFKSSGLLLDNTLLKKIELYHDLILSWSKRINLMSKKDLDYIIKNHFLDSLGIINMLRPNGNLIDIGSGAGFPGIPLSMLLSGLNISLVESVHKRVLFLKEAKTKLALDNVVIIESRLENLEESRTYDIATLRALPEWETLLDSVKKTLRPDGKIILFKRRGIFEEIDP